VIAAAGNASATVTWRAPSVTGGSPVTGYTARAWSATSGGTQSAACTTSGALTCAITGLQNGTTYYVDVVATNTVGTSVNPGARVAVMPRTVPASPGNLAVAAGNSQVTVSWAAPTGTGGSPLTGYTARAWSAASGGTQSRSCATSGTLTCIITGLTNGTSYFVDVVARNAVGASPDSSQRISVTPRTNPGAPAGVTTTAGPGQASVTWTAPTVTGGSAVTGYTARAWSAASTTTPAGTCTSQANSCIITGLANNTTYYVNVVATNAAGPSVASAPWVAVRPALQAPSPPTGVALTAGNGQVTINWGAPASNGGTAITSYTVRAYTAHLGGAQAGACVSGTTSCAIGGLANGTTYFFDVFATNSIGNSPVTSPRLAAVPVAPPPASRPAGACNGFNGAYPMTPAWDDGVVRVEACGPRPHFDTNKPNRYTRVWPTPNTTTEGYQCTELVGRYLYHRYGVQLANLTGAKLVDMYARAFPSRFEAIPNGSGRPPRAGDILSWSDTQNFNDTGHTALVVWSSVDGGGNGVVKVYEQNAGYNATGARSINVRSWKWDNTKFVKWLRAK